MRYVFETILGRMSVRGLRVQSAPSGPPRSSWCLMGLTLIIASLVSCAERPLQEHRPNQTVTYGDPVYQYLEDFQSSLRNGRQPFATDSDREQFCSEWRYITQGMGLGGDSQALQNLGLSARDFDCKKIIEQFLKNVAPSRFSDPEFSFLAYNLSQRLTKAAASLGMDLEPKPVVDAVPLPLLNAKIIEVPGSSKRLVLLNDEVFGLPYEISKSLIQALIPRRVSGEGKMMMISADKDSILSALEARPEVLQRYNYAILRYLRLVPRSGYFLDQRLDDEIGQSIYLIYFDLTDAVELFILGHELAHQILRHKPADGSGYPAFDASLNLPSASANGARSISYSWAQELEADSYGFILMATALTDLGRHKKSEQLPYSYPLTISAPRLFFSYLSSVQRAKTLIETGKAPEKPTKEQLATAIEAIDLMFSRNGTAKHSDDNLPALMLQSDTHPPFWLRILLARILEKELLSRYDGSLDLAELPDAFQRVQEIFDERNTKTFLELHNQFIAKGKKDAN
jgi:hypothetical protein